MSEAARETGEVVRGSQWPSLGDGYWERTIHFVHIPKCAGTAIFSGLVDTFPDSWRQQPTYCDGLDVVAATEATRQQYRKLGWEDFHRKYLKLCQFLVMMQMNRGVCLLGGHYPYSPLARRQFGDRYFPITVLRDPVERAISNVIWLTVRAGKYPMADYLEGRRDPCAMIEEFLEGELFEWMTRAMALQIGGLGRAGKLDFNPEPQIDRATSNAVANIEKFALVGFQDDLKTFGRRLSRKIGIEVVVPRANSTDSFLGDSGLRRRIYDMFAGSRLDRIREACADDLSIYEHARKIWNRKPRKAA